MSKKSNKYAGYDPEAYDPSGIGSYLGLGRPIRFDHGPTRAAFMCAIITAVAVTFWKSFDGMESYEATLAGVGCALGFLLSFMIAQELDPDRSLGGLIGGGLTIAAYLFMGEGNIMVALWLLFVLRMFTRTSGDRHRIADNVIIIGCAVWLGREGLWLYPLLTGVAYVMESQLPGGYFRSLYLAAIALAGMAVSEYSSPGATLTMNDIYIMSVSFIIFMPEFRMSSITGAVGDKNGRRINPVRLLTAQSAFALGSFSVAFMHGSSQVLAMMPANMAALGCGLYLVADLIKNKK